MATCIDFSHVPEHSVALLSAAFCSDRMIKLGAMEGQVPYNRRVINATFPRGRIRCCTPPSVCPSVRPARVSDILKIRKP